jgi:TIR domain
MTDVVISYASENRERARKLASALESLGWSVWWDRKIIAGQVFDQVIEHELETAKCVVVLWSKDSIISEWVKNEAAVAAERGVLVPALIDNVKLPLEFRRKQTADLVGWDGAPSHGGFQALCDGVATKTNLTGVAQRQPTILPQRAFRWHRRWTLGATTAIAFAGLIIVLIQAGVFDRATNQHPVVDAKQIGSTPPPPSVLELESQLKAANIELSTGTEDDVARVRSYFAGPTSAYHLLAMTCLQVMGNRRLRETGYLDMIDKWYTSLVGEEHYVAGDGGLDREKLKAAIVRANNEYYGQSATSFEQLVESTQ